MPGFLSRSKSMRLLMGHRNQTQQDDPQRSMPRLGASKTPVDIYQPGTSRHQDLPEASNMAVRPNTSGGPGDRRTQFHLKTNPVPSMHSENDLASYLSANSSAVLSSGAASNSSEGVIGIALGSPTVGSHWTGTPQASSFITTSPNMDNMSAYPRSNSPVPSTTRTEAPKSKLSRWKSLFRKAAPPPPETPKPAFYQLTTTITANANATATATATATRSVRADSHHDDEQAKPTEQPDNNRDTARTPSPPAFRPNIRASRTFTTPRTAPEPPRVRARAFTSDTLPANPRVSVMRSATNPLSSKRVAKDAPAVPKLAVSKSAQNIPTLSGAKPMLDVSIPDITLERYSVMFGNLLESNANRSNRSSSLLVRRQVNSDKLKPLNNLAVKDQVQESPIDYKLQRRATSPVVPSPSPRLSLFPNTSNSRATSPRSSSVPRSKLLNRANTTPDKSPLNQMFTRKDADSNKGQELFVQKSTARNLKPRASMNLEVQQLSLTPTSIRSFESDTDSITLVVGHTSPGHPQKFHLDDREPEWEILSRPSAITRSNTMPVSSLVRTDSQPKPTKLSALSSHPSSAPLEVSSPLQRIQRALSPPASARRAASETRTDGGDNAPKAMVGVARSVSVSRANSPRTLVGTASEMRSPRDRLVDRQTLTPTMVEVRNRKSQRVQLVDE